MAAAWRETNGTCFRCITAVSAPWRATQTIRLMASFTHQPPPADRAPADIPPAAEAPARPPSRRRAKRQEFEPPPADRPIDVILVGGGPITESRYLPALRTLEERGLVAIRSVVDPSTSTREFLFQEFPRATPRPSLDSVVVPPSALAIIATPPRFHAQQASAALKRGWHVLCSTPFSNTVADGAAMLATAKRHERLIAADLHRRFLPATNYLRALCRDQLLGPLLNFAIHEGTPPAAPSKPPAAGEKFEAVDGVLSEVGVEILDLLTWWLGPASITNYGDDAMGGSEANAFLELSFAEGARGTVHVSHDWPTAQSHVFIFERAVVRWHVTEVNRLTVQLGSAPSALDAQLAEQISETTHAASVRPVAANSQSFLAQLQNVLAAVGGRERLRVPPSEALQSLSLAEACYARRTLLAQPWLTRNETAHARALSTPVGGRRP